MLINKNSGLPLQIYTPNIQSLQPFEYEFYTNPSTEKKDNLVVSFDGQNYSNCKPWKHGVYFYSEHKFKNQDTLFCRATYWAPNPMCANGIQRLVFDQLDTGIKIVHEGGDYFDPIVDPSKLEIPSFNTPLLHQDPRFYDLLPYGGKRCQPGDRPYGARGDSTPLRVFLWARWVGKTRVQPTGGFVAKFV